MMMAAYDAEGHQVATLSGNYSNTIIDLEEIPRSLDPFWPTIGAQPSSGNAAILASVRKRKAERLFIDADGVTFREERRSMAEGGLHQYDVHQSGNEDCCSIFNRRYSV
jgi:hypothetical protein